MSHLEGSFILLNLSFISQKSLTLVNFSINLRNLISAFHILSKLHGFEQKASSKHKGRIVVGFLEVLALACLV
jgi:hypothetical protein